MTFYLKTIYLELVFSLRLKMEEWYLYDISFIFMKYKKHNENRCQVSPFINNTILKIVALPV